MVPLCRIDWQLNSFSEKKILIASQMCIVADAVVWLTELSSKLSSLSGIGKNQLLRALIMYIPCKNEF